MQTRSEPRSACLLWRVRPMLSGSLRGCGGQRPSGLRPPCGLCGLSVCRGAAPVGAAGPLGLSPLRFPFGGCSLCSLWLPGALSSLCGASSPQAGPLGPQFAAAASPSASGPGATQLHLSSLQCGRGDETGGHVAAGLSLRGPVLFWVHNIFQMNRLCAMLEANIREPHRDFQNLVYASHREPLWCGA